MPRCSACGKKNLPGFSFCQKCGAPLDAEEEPASADSRAAEKSGGEEDGFEEQITQLLEQGQKIAAIKLYRQRSGADLAEAKRAVERMQADAIFTDGDLADNLLALLRKGRKIEAIKIYRQRANSGLKDAKEAIEALAAKHGLRMERSGCLAVFLLALALAGPMFTARVSFYRSEYAGTWRGGANHGGKRCGKILAGSHKIQNRYRSGEPERETGPRPR